MNQPTRGKASPSPPTHLPLVGDGSKAHSEAVFLPAQSGAALLPSPASGRGAGGEGDSLLNRAKSLRSHQTDAEQRLWYHLRAHRFNGLKFKRQKPIGPYIVDFVCHAPCLVIELDGGQHVDQTTYDRKRDTYLQAQGFAVLRFWNNQALTETDAVLDAIRLKVLELSTLSPSPSPASGRGEKNSAGTP
ncbi:MAG: endonuclease domain-containing protein [Sterolibacterium sp.]|nr:endonuclease domain-containing protein [Sterolibacterium sp.]